MRKEKGRERRTDARTVAFFRYSYYEPAFRYFAEHVLDSRFLALPPSTRYAEEVGEAQASEEVCTPFKRILGDFTEALEAGADVLIQFTGFCRLTYYGELQEIALRDRGFTDFTMLNFAQLEGASLTQYLARFEEAAGHRLSIPRVLAGLMGCYRMVEHLDEFHAYWFAHAAFEREEGSFARVRDDFLGALSRAHTVREIERASKQAMARVKALPLAEPAHSMRIGVIGDYYTAADAEGNMRLVQRLIDAGMSVSADMTISRRNLHYDEPALRATVSEYLSHDTGPTSSMNLAAARRYADAGFDGIVHAKAACCTPEIDLMPTLQRFSREQGIPMLFLTFDEQTSDAGLETRLEAFLDLCTLRKTAREQAQ